MNIPAVLTSSEPAVVPQVMQTDGAVFQSTLIDFLCHGWTEGRAVVGAPTVEPQILSNQTLATGEASRPIEVSADEEELESLMPLEVLPFLVDVHDWLASSKLDAARPVALETAKAATAADRVTVVPQAEVSAQPMAREARVVNWTEAPPTLGVASPPSSADGNEQRRTSQTLPETFAERVARGASSRAPRVTPAPRNTPPLVYDLAEPCGVRLPDPQESATHHAITFAPGAATSGARSTLDPATITGVARATFDLTPLAATPKTLSAATPALAQAPHEKTKEAATARRGASVDAAPTSATREEIAREVNVAHANLGRDDGALREAVDLERAGAGDVPNLDQTSQEQLPVPSGNLFKPAEQGPLREAVLRAVEREMMGSRDAAEVRQRDVDSGVDSMTLRQGLTARTVLETGDRLEVNVRPEERGMDVRVRVDSREAAELIALVRHDLIADLEGTRLSRVSVSYDGSLGQPGDRRHEGQRDSRPQRDPESAKQATQSPVIPTHAGRVRVVL